ncbi:MAG: FG-GAP repeat domain-containing protein, partial [Pseudonocardiaceae bacterium]
MAGNEIDDTTGTGWRHLQASPWKGTPPAVAPGHGGPVRSRISARTVPFRHGAGTAGRRGGITSRAGAIPVVGGVLVVLAIVMTLAAAVPAVAEDHWGRASRARQRMPAIRRTPLSRRSTGAGSRRDAPAAAVSPAPIPAAPGSHGVVVVHLGVRGRARVVALGVVAAVVMIVLAAPPALAAPAVGFTGPTNFPAGAGPFSVVVGEFNGDARPDLAVANLFSNSVSVLLGDGSGGFTGPTNFPAGDGPFSVVVGEFNGDARPDLAVADNGSNSVSVLLGDGSGGFTGPTNFPAGDGPFSVVVGELNG